MLEDNSELEELLSNRDLPRTTFYELEIGEGYKGWAKVIVPPESDRDQDRKWYPVVFQRYYHHLYVCYIIMLYYTKILEVNLFAFAYRLFHEDFSSIDGTLLYYLFYYPKY